MASTPGTTAPSGTDYSTWSNERLISRITELEQQLSAYAGAVTPASSSTSPSHPSSASQPQTRPAAPAPGAETEEARSRSRSRSPSRTRKQPRRLDPSRYSTRLIALKFAYLGQNYNGFEHTNGNLTPLPTIEEEIYKALRKARLIFPRSQEEKTPEAEQEEEELVQKRLKPITIDWEGCDYSKCGRTDRGVSAFGQVIGVRVRSARPKREEQKSETAVSTDSSDQVVDNNSDDPLGGLNTANLGSTGEVDDWDDIADELPYIHMLNNVLPKDIRVLAWCPHPPPQFDARFHCRERHYRYFFTQPAFSPTPGPRGLLGKGGSRPREGWLDLEAMREAAKHFEGSHDFRNFCKLDTTKQITNFVRNISYADIELVSDPLSYLRDPNFGQFSSDGLDQVLSVQRQEPTVKVYSFTLHGSAFLWHQVRHMVAILFLIGQGLESPSIVPELLDVEKNPRRPAYEMASDAPLVLWDCVFPGLEWIYAGDERTLKSGSSKGDGKFGVGGVVDDLWARWRKCKIDEILAGSLLDMAAKQGDGSALQRGGSKYPFTDKISRSQKLFNGGNDGRYSGKYIPLMQRQKLETVEVQNARYLKKRRRGGEAGANPGADDVE